MSTAPIGVPPAAQFFVAAPSLGELRSMATFVAPLEDVAPASDTEQPAWVACERELCVLRRAAPAERAKVGATWHIPDGEGSVIIWGATDEPAVDAALARWRDAAALVPPTGGWAGFIEPGPILERWNPSSARARELVERVTFEAGRIDFTMATKDGVVDAELRMLPRPGEPIFVGGLGAARVDLPAMDGLTDAGMLGIVRLSADPTQVFDLLRSTLAAPQRAEVDELLVELETRFALDVKSQVLGTLSGHALIFAYGMPGEPAPKITELLSLRATSEVIVLPVTDREPMRRALDAWTQLSGGQLQVQSTGPTETEWAWFVDGEVEWTALLGASALVIADGSGPLTRAQQWMRAEEPAALPAVLETRGVDALLKERDRSGLYIDLTQIRDAIPDLPAFESLTITVEPDGDRELIRARVGL